MVTDIETILDAFKGTWKPGIEEQSIRTAHTVALSGDTATASNILKFIAIPEAMKLQILGASLSGIEPVQRGQIPESTNEPAKPMKMPEPLISDSMPAQNQVIENTTPNDVVVDIPATEAQKVPAFGAELSGEPTPQAESSMDTVPADAGLVVDTQREQKSDIPESPVGALPQNRMKAFENAFNQVKVDASTTTSRPMIKDADNIDVIKTYAEPAVSQTEHTETQKHNQQNGQKMFTVLEATLTRALASKDSHLVTTALTQFERLNSEFPDYKIHNKTSYDSIEKKVQELKSIQMSPETATPTDSGSTVATSDSSASDFVPLEEATTKESFTVDPEPAVVVSAKPSGSYFSKKLTTSIEEAVPEESVHDNPTLDSQPQVVPEASQAVSDVQSNANTEPDKTEITELELSNGIKIVPDMTITGDSIYRVVSLENTGGMDYVIFTNEARKFRVSKAELEGALSNPDTDPDEFFAGHVISE